MSDDLQRMVDKLAIKNATLQAENRYLRRIAKDSRHGRRLRQAIADAKTLLAWRFAGMAITRRNSLEMGLSERRWGAARGLLMVARIHNGIDVVERDFNACVHAVDVAGRQLERDGLDKLLIRIARRGD